MAQQSSADPTQARIDEGPVVWRRPSRTGLVVSAVSFAAALVPSLLPRPLMFLLLLTTVGAIVGYAVGTFAGWLAGKMPWVRRHQGPQWAGWLIVGTAWLAALAFTPISVGWQAEQQSALDMPSALPSSIVLVMATAITATLLLLLSRALRLATRAIASLLCRIPPLARRLADQQSSSTKRTVLAIRIVTASVFVLIGYGLVLSGFTLLVSSYDQVNADTTGQGPANGENSGSTASLVPWDTLGREGRYFVGNTMSPEAITAITQEPAEVPLRLYVGMQQGDTYQSRTDLALAELDRSGAWDREYLAIIAVTGTGWVDPDAINSLEIVTGGDLASVAVQYTAVPSWIGFVLDPQTTQDQNANTINAILQAWRSKPVDQQPELILFGESLGAFGSQSAWPAGSSPSQVTEEISHVIWVGPPAESRLWKQWQAGRTAGPAWQPVIDGGDVARVFINDTELTQAPPLTGPAITFSAHPNDPVVYWSPDLLLRRPAWIEPPLGPGVDPHIRYFPIITYLSLGMDLISGGGPPEVGHNYSGDIGPAIALTVNPVGWSPEKTAAMDQALPGLHYVTG